MRRLMDALTEGDSQEAAETMFYSNADMGTGEAPWTQVGEADITIRVYSKDQLVQNELRSLQAELDHARAEWLTKQQALMERISKLQALTNEVQA
jgi:hypothetical protein